MKKGLIALAITGISLSLTSCMFSCGGDYWKEKYGTPELFLEQVTDHWCYIYTYDSGEQNADTNFEVRDALKEAGPYTPIESNGHSGNEIRYFTYENYISPSTAGPNFCKLSVYDDGLVAIDYKAALSAHSYLYFSIDADKAVSLNDLVFTKIPYEKQVKQEDLEQAMNDGAIENFIAAMESKSHIPGLFRDVDAENQPRYSFNDNSKELLTLIKEAEYSTSKKAFSEDSASLLYNYVVSDAVVGRWVYALYKDGSMVRISYGYKNRLGEENTVVNNYSINSFKGQDILAKAEELARNK